MSYFCINSAGDISLFESPGILRDPRILKFVIEAIAEIGHPLTRPEFRKLVKALRKPFSTRPAYIEPSVLPDEHLRALVFETLHGVGLDTFQWCGKPSKVKSVRISGVGREAARFGMRKVLPVMHWNILASQGSWLSGFMRYSHEVGDRVPSGLSLNIPDFCSTFKWFCVVSMAWTNRRMARYIKSGYWWN